MRKTAIIICLVATGVAGCGSIAEREDYYEAIGDAQKNQKPLFVLEAKDGETVQLSGVKRLEVNAPSQLQARLVRQVLRHRPDAGRL